METLCIHCGVALRLDETDDWVHATAKSNTLKYDFCKQEGSNSWMVHKPVQNSDQLKEKFMLDTEKILYNVGVA